MNPKASRLIYLDVVRIIACLFVIYLHTGNEGAYYYYKNLLDKPLQFGFYSFFSIVCRTAVPLFFCISGILLLGRNESLTILLKKRFIRIASLLLIASLFYYFRQIGFSFEQFSFNSFFCQLYTKWLIGPLWFLYAYLAFLLCIPFIERYLSEPLSRTHFNYLVYLIIIFCGIIPSVEYISTGKMFILNKWFSFLTFDNFQQYWFIVFPVIGYGLHNYRINSDSKESSSLLNLLGGGGVKK